MPRSHPLQNQWRILVAAFAVVLVLCTAFPSDAQQKKRRNRPAQKSAQAGQNSNSTATTGAQQQPAKKNLAALRGSDGPNGGRATITSDAPLNDYEAYRSGNRYYVVIPQANAPGVPGNMSGRGFDDVQVHKRGNDTVLSFRLKPGTTARVQQKFNKLDVVFNSPADSSSGAQSGTSTNGSTAGTTTASTGPGSSSNTQRTGTETASGTAKPPDAATPTGASAGTTPPAPGATPSPANAAATPPTAAASPGSAALPSITPGLGMPGETPSVVASPTPPTDQLAQAQPAPSVPSAITTTPAASGSSLGAVLKSNWLLILIAALILISIGLVAMTRSRSRRGAAQAEARPAGDSETTTPALEEGATATLESARVDTASATEAMPLADMAGLAAGTAVLPDVADETETVEAEPVEALDVERVRLEIKHVLTGEEYDESVINATSRDARQLIESELLFALSRRNTERRDRALKAFTEHGYFDDATRDLRTAAVPAERAAAARKLGLTRDTASTPHLVAALEDTAPEVRRAAIEALTELEDQSAVAPLESLLEREEDRKVPHALIRRAIRASATGPAQQEERVESAATETASAVEAAPVEEAPVEEAPVEAAPVSAQEVASPIAETADVTAEAASTVEEPSVEAPESFAPTAEVPRTIEAEPSAVQNVDAAPAEAATELPAEAIAIAPAIVAGIATAEAERSRAEADAARIHAEQEALRRTEEEERQRAEEEALQRRVQEAARLRAEADERRQAEEIRRREEEQQRRRQAEEEQRRAEEERRRAEEEQRRLEGERQRVEEEHRRAEEERRREDERLRVEEEQRIQAEQRQRAEDERLRLEAEAARQREEAEAERQRVEEEARQREEAERLRAEEEEARRIAEEEAARLRAAEAQMAVTEEQPPLHAVVESADLEEDARLKAFEEERARAEEARRQRVEERERRRAEEERSRIAGEGRERAEADAARRRAEDAALRLAEMRRRVEEEARQREEAERLRAEEEEARRIAEEEAVRLRAAEEEEAAAALQREEEEESARAAAEEERQRAEEEMTRTEEQSRLHAEEERKRVEEEARQREEAEAARIQFERERAEQQEQPSLLYSTEVEATPIEAEEIEPAQAETSSTIVQSDLFEATFTPQTPFVSPAKTAEEAAGPSATDWVEVDFEESVAVLDEQPTASAAPVIADEAAITQYADVEAVPVREVEEYSADASVKEIDVAVTERGIALADEDFNSVPGSILRRLGSEVASDRAAAVSDLARVGGDDAFREISAAFDDPAQLVRDAAARALFGLSDDHAASFTRALREAPPERRRRIGNALANSGLAGEAIGHLMGESREKTYDAFSLLFLMSKAGEVQPLMRAIEEHPNSEVRLAVVKLLALSGQQEILPAFRRLAVRGSLPTEVRSAVMEAIYQISSQASTDTTHVA